MWHQIDSVTGEISTIYDPKEIVNILSNTLNYYTQETINARALAKKTREEVAADIQNEFERENKYLQEKLKFSYGSFNSQKELNDWEEFKRQHLKCYKNMKISQSRCFYIMPYSTGIGTGHIAVCPNCGEKKDITDTSSW